MHLFKYYLTTHGIIGQTWQDFVSAGSFLKNFNIYRGTHIQAIDR